MVFIDWYVNKQNSSKLVRASKVYSEQGKVVVAYNVMDMLGRISTCNPYIFEEFYRLL